jgi:type II secretory pathway pseudopilin PulG
MGMIRKAAGFTIIETMLFLAITAALAVAILVGTGSAINQQRYHDAVNSLRSYLQDQYSRVSTVSNDRDGHYGCDDGGQVSATGTGEARGTSDCLILGRLVTVDNSGQHLASSNVVGYRQAVGPQATDIDELKAYKIGLSPIDTDDQVVSWGATIVQPKTTPPKPQSASILIVRSPLSGRILTFSQTGTVATDPGSLLVAANATTPLLMCLSSPASGLGQVLGVQIDPGAAGQSAVELPTGSSGVCG